MDAEQFNIVCFIGFIIFLTASSLPIGVQLNTKIEQLEAESYWINPCGANNKKENEHLVVNDVEDVYSEFLLELKIIQTRVNSWINDFTIFQFNMTFIDKCAEDGGLHNPWLLAGPADWSTAQNQTMDEFLFKARDILQRFAGAWDQVVVEKDPHFHSQFQQVQNSNRLALCSLELLLPDDDPLANANASDVMPQGLRNLTDDSDRSTRNFRFLTDYITAIEYFIAQLQLMMS